MIKILSVMLCLTLTSCSSLEIRTNAGPFVRAEISSEVVQQYTVQEIRRYEGEFLASLNVSVCSQHVNDSEQRRPKNASISYDHLIRELHVDTQLSGGNALVVHQCSPTAEPDCYKAYQCSGSSYWVDQGK